MSLTDFIADGFERLNLFFVPTSRVYVVYLLTSVVLAFIAWRMIEHEHDHDHVVTTVEETGDSADKPKRGFLGYVFDAKIWLHQSSIQDYKFFFLNIFVYYGLVAQFLISVDGLAWFAHGQLTSFFGSPAEPVISGAPALILYTIVSVLAFDFAVFIAHYLFHKVPFLWAFHKVHHSAEALNPMTLFRVHPIDLFFTGVVVAIMSGITFGGFFYLTDAAPTEMKVLGLNIIVFCFYLIGYNLRHSHVWLNYPAWLSNIFVSPAQHQIHHSAHPMHFDRNMGLIFSFWDKLFGTLYIPRAFEKLTFGINRRVRNPYSSVGGMYLTPFRESWRELKKATRGHAGLAAAGATMVAAGVIYVGAMGSLDGRKLGFNLRSVELAELTWTDVDAALKRGYDTVIVPTGGTEQNGPFVALGKHNFIVKQTSARIAQEAGKTLVAPVLAYVPEGAVEPKPTGWMEYPGTLSLPEPVFEAVLEETAKSLKVHGFKKILFLGDSGGNQPAQDRVAAKLSERWKADGVMVSNLRSYYDDNKQVAYLESQGFTEAQIGSHAGIRDTSELMAVNPKAVSIYPVDISKSDKTGIVGAPGYSTPAIGEEMLALKVRAGVDAVKVVRAHWQQAFGATHPTIAEHEVSADEVTSAIPEP